MTSHPPYFVRGNRSGRETRNLETLEALVRDLRAYSEGRLPGAVDLATAPMISDWAAVTDPSSRRIAGTASSHPRVGPGPALTSQVYAIDRERRWVRTYSRLWRLGPPLRSDMRGAA